MYFLGKNRRTIVLRCIFIDIKQYLQSTSKQNQGAYPIPAFSNIKKIQRLKDLGKDRVHPRLEIIMKFGFNSIAHDLKIWLEEMLPRVHRWHDSIEEFSISPIRDVPTSHNNNVHCNILRWILHGKNTFFNHWKTLIFVLANDFPASSWERAVPKKMKISFFQLIITEHTLIIWLGKCFPLKEISSFQSVL